MSAAGSGELLLEVRAEEIPARMLEPAAEQLAGRLFEELTTAGLGPTEVTAAYTPRRLVVVLKGLPEGEEDREEEAVGPPARVAFKEDGSPSPALIGFAKRLEADPADAVTITTDKGEYVAIRRQVKGRAMKDILADMLPRALAEISWSKQMRWGRGGADDGPWVRPVHGVVALFGGEVVPFELFGVPAGNTTVGHPVLSPDEFEVTGPDDYHARLAERHVELRPEARRKALADAMAERARALGGTVVDDPALLHKLAAICEIPGVMEGSFDERYTELPREVLVASLKDHQSAFTVEAGNGEEGSENGDGRLLPAFLTVMDRPDDPAGRVRAGNEWVVEARLADARFFYGEDKKTKLAERAKGLDRLTFHPKLGSYAAKAERIASLSELVCRHLGMDDQVPEALEAAALLKADLTSQMVIEFTSLQGQVGGIYAREEGYPEAVWQAVYDQYLPASTEDPIPRGDLGRVTALADRIDTLVGIFGLGLIPSGSRDPFGLRRAAQGVVRICLEGGLTLDLDLVAAKAARLYQGENGDGKLERSGEEILADLRPFFHDRVRYLLGLRGFAYDEIEAALLVEGSDLPDLAARVEALHEARQGDDFLSLVLSAKRIANITKDAAEHSLQPDALVEPAEKDLHQAYLDLKQDIDQAVADRDYPRGLERVARMAPVLDRFFDEVLVMDEDERLRHNRIALLQAIHRSLTKIARLTELVVDKSEHRERADKTVPGDRAEGDDS